MVHGVVVDYRHLKFYIYYVISFLVIRMRIGQRNTRN